MQEMLKNRNIHLNICRLYCKDIGSQQQFQTVEEELLYYLKQVEDDWYEWEKQCNYIHVLRFSAVGTITSVAVFAVCRCDAYVRFATFVYFRSLKSRLR